MMERFGTDDAALPPDRRAAHATIVARRGALPLPYRALLASPDVALQVDALSARLWEQGRLSQGVLEAVFLVTARRFKCQHQWERHEPKALAAGVTPACVAAIAKGIKPPGPQPVTVACQLAKRLLSGQRVGPRLWTQALRELGEAGVADLCAFLGLSSLVAMTINLQQM